ncbi:hypothetical protein D9757_003956 [Collybiopsis confluens]|uniref:Acetyl-CoA synthetase-like protein n=1 Tax=Collybiopsis confluens TaxID=2823264 RepID=A0A8H5HX29_9AGAR|nr:hypothetical protein D9757_003956 [Collybiopsis confluens]
MAWSQAVASLEDIPTNLSVPQFLLDDFDHATRPVRLSNTPCLIDNESGERVFMEQLRRKTRYLASAVNENWNFNEGDIVAIMSPNTINFPPCVWATHRLGGIVATLSPSLSVDELVHHLTIARPSLFFVHTDCLSVAIQSASRILLPLHRVVILDRSTSSSLLPSYQTFDGLIQQGSMMPPVIEKAFKEDEAKTRIAFLAPSSGTTGMQKASSFMYLPSGTGFKRNRPQAVAISHFNVISIIIQAAKFNRIGEDYGRWEERRFRPGDICCGFLPLYRKLSPLSNDWLSPAEMKQDIYGLVYNLHFMLYAGMSLVLAPRFHFESFLKSIERYRMTHLTIVPPQAVLLCKHPAVKNYSLSSWTFEGPTEHRSSWPRLRGVFVLILLLRMTETCGTVSMFPLSQKIGTLGSGGQLLPGTKAKVVKEDGTIAQVGEVGELYVQGGQVALGYYGNQKASSWTSWTNNIKSSSKETFVNGWLRTGDQVFFEKNGDIFIVDRIKELIKVKGLQVAPAELEGHLLMHPRVADAAVIGTPNEYAGELPTAFVVLQASAVSLVIRDPKYADDLRSSIFRHVADAKSKHKWLTGGIIFVDTIPRNASGKILRRLLRESVKQKWAAAVSVSRLHIGSNSTALNDIAAPISVKL